MKHFSYPVVDLFAGPGGLGEGFLSLRTKGGKSVFSDAVSIEKDEHAYQTLLLRHFLRAFGEEGFPYEYYAFLSGEIDLETFYQIYPDKIKQAQASARRLTLGVDNHFVIKSLICGQLGKTDQWALIGGPPCQAYSLVGRSRMMGHPEFENDSRHFLYREYLKTISDHSPPVFVMENVKGLLSAKVNGALVIEKILADLSAPAIAIGGNDNQLRYNLYSLSSGRKISLHDDPREFLVKSENYGVPQARHRMFILGIRSDLDVLPRPLKVSKAPTVHETIGLLPKVRSGLSKGDSLEAWRSVLLDFDNSVLGEESDLGISLKTLREEISKFLKLAAKGPMDRRSTRYPARSNLRHEVIEFLHDDNFAVLTGHESRGHMPSDLHRYLFSAAFASVIGRSPKLSDFPEVLLPDHKNVLMGRSGKMFSDRFRVQVANSHATTITSHISKDGHYFIHYDPVQCRSLTVREAARLQTFPDNYFFVGPRTSQFHQIGNAVPPFLAVQIAEIVSEVLSGING